MSFTNNRFDRFPYFDPESKLSEFRKKFFQDQNKLFNDTNRWPNGMADNFMAKTDANPFEAKEEGIPIKVIHETSDDRPNSQPNDDKNFDSMSSKSFGSSQSQRSSDTSKSSGSKGSLHSNRSRESNSGEPRVHHIPITVEGRDGPISSGSTSEANQNVEQPLSRSSSHSSAHSVGSTGRANSGHNRNQNRSYSPLSSTPEPIEKKERVTQIPVEIKTNETQRTASIPTESKPKANGSTPKTKPKPKSGPFVTRIPVFNQNECQSQTNPKEPVPEVNENNEPKVVPKLDPLDKINEILTDLKKYEAEVNQFDGTADDKQYRFLDEMLTRFMIKLDNIETDGKEDVRKARKAAVLAVNNCIASLERKVLDKKQAKVETSIETTQTNPTEESMQMTPEEQKPLPDTTEEPTDSKPMESQTTNAVAEDTTEIQSNQTKDNSQQKLNSTESQCLNKKPNESQRKETAV